MTIANADLHGALNAVWDASSLDAAFRALWDAAVVVGEFPVLHDGEASSEQPFPYCVYELSPGVTTDRMSDEAGLIREIRDVPGVFRVHARAIDGDARTAKQIASELAENVMEQFGGHPSVAAQTVTLDSGRYLITQYQNDYGIKTGDNEYSWSIAYNFRIDVPVSV